MDTYNKIVLGLQQRTVDVIQDPDAKDLVVNLCR